MKHFKNGGGVVHWGKKEEVIGEKVMECLKQSCYIERIETIIRYWYKPEYDCTWQLNVQLDKCMPYSKAYEDEEQGFWLYIGFFLSISQ